MWIARIEMIDGRSIEQSFQNEGEAKRWVAFIKDVASNTNVVELRDDSPLIELTLLTDAPPSHPSPDA